MKLVRIERSGNKNKKYVATFSTDDKLKKIHFGDSRHDDYTIHHDKKRRESYRARHYTGKSAKPDTANALSYHILWGESTSLQQNIKDYKKRFNL